MALAHAHGMALLHRPFQSAHGLNFAFEDFLALDERGLVMPLAAPVLTTNAVGELLVEGIPTKVATVARSASSFEISKRLRAASEHSLTLVRKGRFAFADADPTACVNCSMTPETRYTALWLRERFWRAVRAREQLLEHPPVEVLAKRSASSRPRGRTASSIGATAGSAPARSPLAAEVSPIRVAIHVRRGDVTYLDKYSKPSARWVQTVDMLEVLRGVRAALGLPLTPPAVRVDLFSESKGWHANDTAALRAVAPHANVHLDSSAAATIDALVTMSRADMLLMGSSGFSTWSAIFSCGVKVGPAHTPMMPMRHVPYSNTLTARSGAFETAALPQLREVWQQYWRCKEDPACRPTLCAPAHLSDFRWAASGLAREYVSSPLAAQWHVPVGVAAAGAPAPISHGEAASDGRSAVVQGWAAARQACTLKGGAALTACVRGVWARNVSNSLSLKHRLAVAAAANSSSAAAAAAATSAATASVGTASSAGAADSVPTGSGAAALPAHRPTKVVQRGGRDFLVWADDR